jgi:hypothetical protein
MSSSSDCQIETFSSLLEICTKEMKPGGEAYMKMDPETVDEIDDFIEINRRGFITDQSQANRSCGILFQRAFIDGLLPKALAPKLLLAFAVSNPGVIVTYKWDENICVIDGKWRKEDDDNFNYGVTYIVDSSERGNLQLNFTTSIWRGCFDFREHIINFPRDPSRALEKWIKENMIAIAFVEDSFGKKRSLVKLVRSYMEKLGLEFK